MLSHEPITKTTTDQNDVSHGYIPSRIQMSLNTAELMICESARFSFMKKMAGAQN